MSMHMQIPESSRKFPKSFKIVSKCDQNRAKMELKWSQSAPVELPSVPVREHLLFNVPKCLKCVQNGAKMEPKSEKM